MTEELNINETLQKGIEAHKAGQVQEADRLYTAILKAQPKHPDANHNMGVLAVSVGKVQEALPFFKTALEANQHLKTFGVNMYPGVNHSLKCSNKFSLYPTLQSPYQ